MLDPEQELLDVILGHRSELTDLARVTYGLGQERKDGLIEILASSGERLTSEDSQKKLVEDIYAIGRYSRGIEADTGFMESDITIESLAGLMYSKYADTARRAFEYLLQYARPDRFDLLRGLIATPSHLHPDFPWPRLQAMLSLTRDERESLLSQTSELDVRARLGDGGAEHEILGMFESGGTYQEKRSAAKLLGYAATDASAKALLGAMNSDLAKRTPQFDKSIRADLLEELGRIHPEVPLFTVEIQTILREGEDSFGIEKTREYLDRVQDWGRRVYGITITPNGDPLLYRTKIIKRPAR